MKGREISTQRRKGEEESEPKTNIKNSTALSRGVQDRHGYLESTHTQMLNFRGTLGKRNTQQLSKISGL